MTDYSTAPLLAQIEQGIKDAINALNRPYIAEIKTYGGEFDVSNAKDFAQVVSRFPAIWTTFAGASKPKKIGANHWQRACKFVVLVGANSIRTEETARHGAYTQAGKLLSVGSFKLIEDVELALLSKKLGLGIAPFEPLAIRTLFNTKTERETVSVLAYEWQTSINISKFDAESDQAADLDLINIDYLPDDDVIASDLINLTKNPTHGVTP